ncbi:MAG: hypothetical protein ACRD1Y_11215 [Terriglobales bacterium]
MIRLWHGLAEITRQRDHALVRVMQLEARLTDLGDDRDRLTAELRRAGQALERVVDNVLFAAGAAPVFAPEERRFQPRSAEAQTAEAERARTPLGPEEWRRRIEQADAERAARDRKARLMEQLKAEVTARKAMDAKQHTA